MKTSVSTIAPQKTIPLCFIYVKIKYLYSFCPCFGICNITYEYARVITSYTPLKSVRDASHTEMQRWQSFRVGK